MRDNSLYLDDKHPLCRWRLNLRGRVQGVGFRPFVFRLARSLGLAGWVENNTQGVTLEVEGTAPALDAFYERLQRELPPLARIRSLSREEFPPQKAESFRIAMSRNGHCHDVEITPDAALCRECLQELFNPGDRRHGYPFITCTHCGPRYSIVRSIPYDRPATTMAAFPMCPECRAEYEEVTTRRFHAQPIACPQCGPKAWVQNAEGKVLEGDPFQVCVKLLRMGKVVAIKGLGGFHLACRAGNDEAVRSLRFRKDRETKPFALMVASLEEARSLAQTDEEAMAALMSPAHPIVLMPKREDAPISPRVAPGTYCFGIMLPYTPLHALLFAKSPGPLVMTSGNPAAEPLCHTNEEALERLAGLADAFLLHDRPIERPVDDSVIMTFSPMEKLVGADATGNGRKPKRVPIRRARGYVPDPITLTRRAPHPILALGGDLKSAVCVLSGNRAVLSEHLGELFSPKAYGNFTHAIQHLMQLLEVKPEMVACDMHPDYASTRYARTLNLPVKEVQHHHAHILSCMAENKKSAPVIGICCDGTGFGEDRAIWGCEVLVCWEGSFHRAGHLDYFPLVGGDAGAKETWRPAAGLLHQAFGAEWQEAAEDRLAFVDPEALALMAQRLAGSAPLPRTSSLGRLFDGIASLLGLSQQNRHEAEAPMALEAAAWSCSHKVEPLPYTLEKDGKEEALHIDVRPLIRSLLQNLRRGQPVSELALAFHLALSSALADCVLETAKQSGIKSVALSGGSFVNRLLLQEVSARLEDKGMELLLHRHVPPGDGGIALGQAVAACCC